MYIVAVFYENDDETVLCAYDTQLGAREAVKKALTKLERSFEEVMEGDNVIYKDLSAWSNDPNKTYAHAMIVPMKKYITQAELVNATKID